MDIGAKLLVSLVEAGDSILYHNLRLDEKFFFGDEVPMFEFVQGYVDKYSVLPKIETIIEQFGDVPVISEPVAFYADQLEERYAFKRINKGLVDCSDLMKMQDHWTAMNVLQEITNDIRATRIRRGITEFTQDAYGLFMADFVKKQGVDKGGIQLGWPYLDNLTGGLRGGDVLSVVGRPAMGKATPLTTRIKTPTGWTTMGHIKVGDAVASVDGAVSEVTGVFPQGNRPVYEIVFQDGRTAKCDEEHLWEVFYCDWESPRVITTKKLLSMLSKKRYQNRLSIRLCSGDFGVPLEQGIDPWLMGFLLGDGCFRAANVMYSTGDNEIVKHIDKVSPAGCYSDHRKNYDYALMYAGPGEHPVRRELKSWGLWGLKSEEKFIPSGYMNLHRAGRVALLSGLLDSDGWVEKTGSLMYCTTSFTLAQQLRELVWSLGGKASMWEKKTTGLLAYTICIQVKNPKEFLTLKRKKDRARVEHTHAGKVADLRLVIESIKPVGKEKCQCISVSHPSKLFIIDDYVVTHNTFSVLYGGYHAMVAQKKKVLAVSMEMSTPLILERVVAMHAKVPMTHVHKGELTGFQQKKVEHLLVEAKDLPGKMWILDGNFMASVSEIMSLVSQFQPDLLLVDGAYLLGHEDHRMNKYQRAEANIELIKRGVSSFDIPAILSYQFNRDAAKKVSKKDGEKVGLQDIAHSDAIGQTSSIVLGMFEEETVETLYSRYISVLKGRHGEIGGFKINWDFKTMDFSQIPSEKDKAKAMQFI